MPPLWRELVLFYLPQPSQLRVRVSADCINLCHYLEGGNVEIGVGFFSQGAKVLDCPSTTQNIDATTQSKTISVP